MSCFPHNDSDEHDHVSIYFLVRGLICNLRFDAMGHGTYHTYIHVGIKQNGQYKYCKHVIRLLREMLFSLNLASLININEKVEFIVCVIHLFIFYHVGMEICFASEWIDSDASTLSLFLPEKYGFNVDQLTFLQQVMHSNHSRCLL